VHDALRVHEDLHLCGRQSEQQARLDQLQPLVHERGAVHGDLAAHDPVGMREGGFRSDGGKRFARVSRNGPPEAVSSTRFSPAGATPDYTGGRH